MKTRTAEEMRIELKRRRANFKSIIANKKPTELEKRILNAKIPSEIKDSLVKDYNQIYYNEKKPNRTTRTDIASEILMGNILKVLNSWDR